MNQDQIATFIEQFIADLNIYATGIYLRENEKQYWEQPFDPEAIPKLHELLNEFLEDRPHTIAEATKLITQLSELNREYEYSLIELEEEIDLNYIIHQILLDAGIDEEELKQLPEFD